MIKEPGASTQSISEQVEAEFACEHAEVEMRRRIVQGNVKHVYRQCVACGKSFGAVGSQDLLPGTLASMTAFDEELRTRYSERRAARWKELAAAAGDRRTDEWWRRYQAYIATPEWKHKRDLVLQRDRRICQSCREAPATDVHHTTYDHLGNEPCFELFAVCRPCHERLHGRPLGVAQ